MKPLHLVIALPHRLLADALAEYIAVRGAEITVCGTATDTRQIFDLLTKCPASVLIYDPYLPGPGPEVICCRLRREHPGVSVILMKASNANGRFKEAENCRPAAIISSDADPAELLESIRSAYETGSTQQSERKQWFTGNEAEEDGKEQLTEREIEIASYIAKGQSAKEIGIQMSITENTVRTHRQNILKKLGLNNKAQLISWYITSTGNNSVN